MKTIKMTRAQHKAWNNALDTLPQGKGTLKDNNGGYCCLGALQYALDSDVERNYERDNESEIAAYPSMDWLATHGISFFDNDGEPVVSPALPSLGCVADVANDGKPIAGVRRYSFAEIKAAIAECIEYTDE